MRDETKKKKELTDTINEHIIVSKYQVNNKLTLKVITKPSYRYRKVTKAMADSAKDITDFKQISGRKRKLGSSDSRSKSDFVMEDKKNLVPTVTIDGFFSNRIQKKMKLNDLDNQIQMVRGDFLLRLNKDDFDNKELAFYKRQIKAKNFEVRPAEEEPVNLLNMTRDDVVSGQKLTMETKKTKEYKSNLSPEVSKNGVSDLSVYQKDHGNHDSAGDKLIRIMERHPDVFKTRYLAQHRRKLKRESFLGNQDQVDSPTKFYKFSKPLVSSASFFQESTKNMITSSLEAIENELKVIDKFPQSICQFRHPRRHKQLMASHDPSYTLNKFDLMQSVKKVRLKPSQIKVNQAVMSWLQSKTAES